MNVVRLDVGTNSGHLLINAFPVREESVVVSVREFVAARFSELQASVVLQDGEGRIHVRSSPTANAEDVALAAAAYSGWAHDEADPMTIIVGERKYDSLCCPRFVGDVDADGVEDLALISAGYDVSRTKTLAGRAYVY